MGVLVVGAGCVSTPEAEEQGAGLVAGKADLPLPTCVTEEGEGNYVLDNEGSCFHTSKLGWQTAKDPRMVGGTFAWLPRERAGWARWELLVPREGRYALDVVWPATLGRNRSAVYEVHRSYKDQDPVVIPVDQVIAGSSKLLGVFELEPAHLPYVTVTSAGEDDTAVDALVAHRLDEAEIPAEVQVDDGDAGFYVDGGWWTSTSEPGFLGGGYHVGKPGGGYVTWTPEGIAPGQYTVYARWTPHANRASNARYVVYSKYDPVGGASVAFSTGFVDQRKTPDDAEGNLDADGWYPLINLEVEPGDAPVVQLGTRGADGFVIADAVLFVRAPDDDL